ncbi:hypothetical protein O181_013950 [Austropuccinia psidii MF-1]|uniref:Uncharacterized protein n=1 Tax=Austropuccinia psidii MF-1 TaxID=1389203 RepID=A0A9Q3GPG0_9BASI|nr:hypothetical protein [Austropuccinia psidii MF-1]
MKLPQYNTGELLIHSAISLTSQPQNSTHHILIHTLPRSTYYTSSPNILPFCISLALAELSAVSTEQCPQHFTKINSQSKNSDSKACFISTPDAEIFFDFTQGIHLLLKTRHTDCGFLPLLQLIMNFISKLMSGHGIVLFQKRADFKPYISLFQVAQLRTIALDLTE